MCTYKPRLKMLEWDSNLQSSNYQAIWSHPLSSTVALPYIAISNKKFPQPELSLNEGWAPIWERGMKDVCRRSSLEAQLTSGWESTAALGFMAFL